MVAGDNGAGPRTLTNYTGNTAGNISGVFKLAGGHIEFGQVRRGEAGGRAGLLDVPHVTAGGQYVCDAQ